MSTCINIQLPNIFNFSSFAQASRFNEFAEMALMRVLDACTDESKLVSMKSLSLKYLVNMHVMLLPMIFYRFHIVHIPSLAH